MTRRGATASWRQAWEKSDSGVRPEHRRILCAVSVSMGGDGGYETLCCPSYIVIGQRSGYAENTARRYTKEVVTVGWLRAEKNGRGRRYRARVPKTVKTFTRNYHRDNAPSVLEKNALSQEDAIKATTPPSQEVATPPSQGGRTDRRSSTERDGSRSARLSGGLPRAGNDTDGSGTERMDQAAIPPSQEDAVTAEARPATRSAEGTLCAHGSRVGYACTRCGGRAYPAPTSGDDDDF